MGDSDAPSNHSLDKRLALLEQSVTAVKKELSDLNSNLSKLIWAVALALVAAVVQWILRGGLNG